MKKSVQAQQINVNYRAMPVFSDRSATISHVASVADKKDKKKAVHKEGVLRILLIDSVSNSTVADIAMTPIAARHLANGISQTLERMGSEMSDPKIRSASKPVRQSQDYIR